PPWGACPGALIEWEFPFSLLPDPPSTNRAADSRTVIYQDEVAGVKAAWYEKQGAAQDVLTVGEMDEPRPRAGEVRIRIAVSGVNPGDVKKRENAFGVGMAYPRVIPHSDGAGTVDVVGEGVSPDWIGKRVWCYGAQSYRPFGTAAEYTVVPLEKVV